MEAAAALLVGGRSLRMGRDKAALAFEGRPLVAILVERLRRVFPEVLVVGREPRDLPAPLPIGIRACPDREPGRGPLGGVVTALERTRCPILFVLAVDMPRFSPEVAEGMIPLLTGDFDAVVPRRGSDPEPLHAIYSRRCLGPALELLAEGRGSPRALLDRVRVRWVERSPGPMSDVDTPADWARFLENARP